MLVFFSDIIYEQFEDTKATIRIRILKKNRQHNGQKKKYKRTNNNLQNIHNNSLLDFEKKYISQMLKTITSVYQI
jgi:hypothetical protein